MRQERLVAVLDDLVQRLGHGFEGGVSFARPLTSGRPQLAPSNLCKAERDKNKEPVHLDENAEHGQTVGMFGGVLERAVLGVVVHKVQLGGEPVSCKNERASTLGTRFRLRCNGSIWERLGRTKVP